MADLVEMEIDSIRVSLVSQQQVLLLRERNGKRYLPIWIGAYEANAIQLALHEVELSRPMTHDLLKNILLALGARVDRVEVTALREGTFYGNIVLSHQGRIYNIDSRPSDAIAVAVRMHAPIFVAREVLDEAGITPDEDLGQSEEAAAQPPQPEEHLASSSGGVSAVSGETSPEATEPATENEDSLSVFAEFLDKLDLGDAEDESPDDDGESEQ